MDDIFEVLERLINLVQAESESFDLTGREIAGHDIEHGSHEQTRKIVLKSIAEGAVSDLDRVKRQLLILKKEIY